jgi:hypothetical protein
MEALFIFEGLYSPPGVNFTLPLPCGRGSCRMSRGEASWACVVAKAEALFMFEGLYSPPA